MNPALLAAAVSLWMMSYAQAVPGSPQYRELSKQKRGDTSGLVTTSVWQRENPNMFDTTVSYFAKIDELKTTYYGAVTGKASGPTPAVTIPYLIATGQATVTTAVGAQPTVMNAANVQMFIKNKLADTSLEVLCRLDENGKPVEALDGTVCFKDEGQAACFLIDYDGKQVKSANFNIQTGTTKQIVATPVAKAKNLVADDFLLSVLAQAVVTDKAEAA